jgi:hypothetical protein
MVTLMGEELCSMDVLWEPFVAKHKQCRTFSVSNKEFFLKIRKSNLIAWRLRKSNRLISVSNHDNK